MLRILSLLGVLLAGSAVAQTASPAYSQGYAARQAWESWISSLTGNTLSGALYWAGQRSLPRPGSCFTTIAQSLSDFTTGCLQAQQRLGPVDARRKTDQDFWYGWNALPAAAPTSTPPPSSRPRQIGPSYDCNRAITPLTQFICADPGLSRADLIFVQPYYVMRHQAGPGGWQVLKVEAIDIATNVAALCGMADPAGPLPADVAALKTCLQAAYLRQAAVWTARLTGPAGEEAGRLIEVHIELQRRLQTMGYLPATETIDGIYGTITRGGIIAWQQATGRPATGFLSNADAAVLASAPVLGKPLVNAPMTVPPTAFKPPPVPSAPVPTVSARFPIIRSKNGVQAIVVADDIVTGDADLFVAAVKDMTEAPLVMLSSPGGKVMEGLAIARLVHAKHWDTYALRNCVSICFAIFAAGDNRSYAPGTRFGVHSASARMPTDTTATESDVSFAVTMEIVRAIQSFNPQRPFPEMILGKLVSKARGEIAMLTPGDLLAMDAYIDPPVITPEIERKVSEHGGETPAWIKAYTSAYAHGLPPIYCHANRGCLEGAHDYAVAVGMPDVAAEAIRLAR